MLFAALVSAALASPDDRTVFMSARGDLLRLDERAVAPAGGFDVSFEHSERSTVGFSVSGLGSNAGAAGLFDFSARTPGPVAPYVGAEAGLILFDPANVNGRAYHERRFLGAGQAGMRFQNGPVCVRVEAAVGRAGDSRYARAGATVGLGFSRATDAALVRR